MNIRNNFPSVYYLRCQNKMTAVSVNRMSVKILSIAHSHAHCPLNASSTIRKFPAIHPKMPFADCAVGASTKCRVHFTSDVVFAARISKSNVVTRLEHFAENALTSRTYVC